MVTATRTTTAYESVASVLDPEVPVLTIADLGVLRDVQQEPDGRVTVTITPTYSGCPAMDAIRDDIRRALSAAGYHDVEIKTVLAPAWTTEWMTPEGKRKLQEFGIAPPRSPRTTGPVPVTLGLRLDTIECPRCGSRRTREVSRFGSTACKSHWTCADCLEPFDHFKSI